MTDNNPTPASGPDSLAILMVPGYAINLTHNDHTGSYTTVLLDNDWSSKALCASFEDNRDINNAVASNELWELTYTQKGLHTREAPAKVLRYRASTLARVLALAWRRLETIPELRAVGYGLEAVRWVFPKHLSVDIYEHDSTTMEQSQLIDGVWVRSLATLAEQLNDMGLDRDDFKDDAALQRALAADKVWSMTWYPDTPIGSYTHNAPSLQELMSDMVGIVEQLG